MNYSTDEYNRAKSEMLDEFNKAIAKAGELREASAVADGGSADSESAGDDAAGASVTVVDARQKKG